MSGKICRETYCNYGSYLRSRGYDKAICDLITMIENGQISIGPFKPKDACNALIEGTLEIVECPSVPNVPGAGGPDNGTGQLWLMGGYAGEDTPSPAALQDLGLQVKHGQHTQGPVIQTRSIATAPNGAVIPGGDHKVTIAGGLPGNPANTGNPPNPNLLPVSITGLTNANYFEYDTVFTKEVHIGGNLLVDGSGTIQHAAEADTILLRPFAFQDQAKLKIFGINSNTTEKKELVSVWQAPNTTPLNQADIEANWENTLAFSIDGNPESPYDPTAVDLFGQTGINGRTRALRGLTVTDPNYMGLGTALPNPPYLNASNNDIQQNALDIRGNVLISAGSNSGATGTTPATLKFEPGSKINMQSQTPSVPVNIDKIIRQVTPAAALTAPGNVNNTSLATTQAIKTYVDSVVDANNDLQFTGNAGAGGQVDLTTQSFSIVGAPVVPLNITTSASNQQLKIDLVPTTVSPNTYGGTSGTGTTQAINVPNFQVDQYGRLTSAGESGNIDVMSSFDVKDPANNIYDIKNSGELDFTNGSNLTVGVSSAGAGNASVEYGLNTSLTGLVSVTTQALTLGTSNAVTGVDSGTITNINGATLATTNAIQNYVNSNAGFTFQDGTSNSISVTPGGTLTAENDAEGNIVANWNVAAPAVRFTLSKKIKEMVVITGTSAPGGTNGYSLQLGAAQQIAPTAQGNIILNPGLGTLTAGGAVGTVTNNQAGRVDITGALNVGSPSTVVGGLNSAGDASFGRNVTVEGRFNLTGIPTTANSSLGSHKILLVNPTNGAVSRAAANTVLTGANQISSLRYKENVEIMTEEAAGDLITRDRMTKHLV